MNNLLIGGSGFIGSALGQELVRRNDTVVSVSLSGDGDAPGVTSIAFDLYQEPCPQDLLEEADHIFILVGQTHQGFDVNQEKKLVTTLAKAMQNCRAKVYYFSTVNVYGESPNKALETSPCHPLDDYGQFKLAAEGIIRHYIPEQQLTIFRLTNTYGSPRNRGFIGLLMRKLSENDPCVSLNGDGEQRRDYIFIDDLVQAIIAVRDKPNEFGIVNIATGTTYSLIQVVDLVNLVSGTKLAYSITHRNMNEAQDCLVDNTRLRQDFDYDTFTSLKQGLVKTLKRYREELK